MFEYSRVGSGIQIIERREDDSNDRAEEENSNNRAGGDDSNNQGGTIQILQRRGPRSERF